MTFPLPIRTAGDTATEHVDDHNEIHGILGGGLPTGLTTSSTGHLANHNTIHTILNATEGQSLPTGIAAGATGHLSHHNTIHTVLNEAPPVPYGPTLGAAAIRSGAGARTVASPGGGISFNSSSSLQTAINANANDSTFVCSTNTPSWTANVWVGTKNPTIIFPGTVGQCIIDAGGGNFIGIGGPSGSRLTVKGGTWRNFGTSAQGVALNAIGDSLIEDVVATDCWWAGMGISGNNNRVSHCTVYANGRNGINGSGNNTTIEYCEIYGNNVDQQNPGIDGGAGKINNGGNGWYHHNWVYGNVGFGAWWDTNTWQWIIEENVCENNYLSGMFVEATYGMTIRNNYIANNGRTTVIGGFPASRENTVNVRLSDDAADRTDPNGQVTPVDFHRNIVDDDGTHGGLTGALLLAWDHSATAARHAANYDIHDNQFWLRTSTTQRVGGLDTAPVAYPVWSSDIRFFDNEYRVASTAVSYWAWGTGTAQGSAQTFAQWQAFHPTGETRVSI